MLRRLISLTTAGLISIVAAGAAMSQSQTGNEAQRVDTLKARVAKIGTGKKVQVKLLSNQMLIGTVDVIGDDQFTLIESPRRAAIPLRYQQLKSIKKPGGDWGNFAALVGIVAGIIGFTALGLRGD
jgi:hypothetical protein